MIGWQMADGCIHEMDEWMHEQVFGIDDVMCYVRTSVSHSTDNLKRKMTGSAERECGKNRSVMLGLAMMVEECMKPDDNNNNDDDDHGDGGGDDVGNDYHIRILP